MISRMDVQGRGSKTLRRWSLYTGSPWKPTGRRQPLLSSFDTSFRAKPTRSKGLKQVTTMNRLNSNPQALNPQLPPGVSFFPASDAQVPEHGADLLLEPQVEHFAAAALARPSSGRHFGADWNWGAGFHGVLSRCLGRLENSC